MVDNPYDSIYCMLVPLQQHYLLLPNTTIAEAIPKPRNITNDSHINHFIGHYEWRNNNIKVIDLERLLGKNISNADKATKLCILNGINTDANVEFFALLCYGSPQLITLNQSALRITHDIDNSDLIHCQIKIGNKVALIPNLDKIEELVSQLK